MLNFDTINLDGSIFKNDLHNGPPTSSFDREIQVHHEQQDKSSSQKASENYTTNKNKLINQNQMMEALTGAISNILKEDKKIQGIAKGK